MLFLVLVVPKVFSTVSCELTNLKKGTRLKKQTMLCLEGQPDFRTDWPGPEHETLSLQ